MTFEEAEIQRIQSEIEKNRAERDKYRREAQEISRRLNRKWYQNGQNLFSLILAAGFLMFAITHSEPGRHLLTVLELMPDTDLVEHEMVSERRLLKESTLENLNATKQGNKSNEQEVAWEQANDKKPGTDLANVNDNKIVLPVASSLAVQNPSRDKQKTLEEIVQFESDTAVVSPFVSNEEKVNAETVLPTSTKQTLVAQTNVETASASLSKITTDVVEGLPSVSTAVVALQNPIEETTADTLATSNLESSVTSEQSIVESGSSEKAITEQGKNSSTVATVESIALEKAELQQQLDELTQQKHLFEQAQSEKANLSNSQESLASEKNHIAKLNKELAKSNSDLQFRNHELETEAKQLAQDKQNLLEQYRVLSAIKKEDRDSAALMLGATPAPNAQNLEKQVMAKQVNASYASPYGILNGAHVRVQFPEHNFIEQIYADLTKNFAQIGVKTSKQITGSSGYLVDAKGKQRKLNRSEISFTLSHTSDERERAKAQLIQQYLIEHGFATTIWKTDMFPSLLLNTIVD